MNNYGNSYPSQIEYPLEEELCKVHGLSKVPIRSAQDIIGALIEREILDKLLEQGLGEVIY